MSLNYRIIDKTQHSFDKSVDYMAIFWCREHDFNHTWNYEQLKPWPKPQIKHGKKIYLENSQ